MILSAYAWVQYQHVTEGRTDRIAVAIMRLALCAVARKNYELLQKVLCLKPTFSQSDTS